MQVTHTQVDEQSAVSEVSCDCGGTEFTITVTHQKETVWVELNALLLQCVRCKTILKVDQEVNWRTRA